MDPRCYACGRRVSSRQALCPSCGAVQISLCDCGEEFSVYADACPACGLEGPGKVYRRNWKGPVRILLVLVLLGVVGYAALRYFARGGSSARKQALKAANDAFRVDDFEKARLILRKLVREEPSDHDTALRLIDTLRALAAEREDPEYNDEAVQLAEEILGVDPTAWEAALHLADLAYSRGEHATALRRAEQVLSLRPDQQGQNIAHRIAGLVLSQPGYRSVGRAFLHLQAAFEGGDRDTEGLLRLAGIVAARERTVAALLPESGSKVYIDAAKREVDQFVAENPDIAEARFFRALFEFSQRRYKEALEDLDAAEKLGANRAHHRLLRGKLQWIDGNRGGAKRTFDGIESEGPTVPVLLEIARFYQEAGEPGLTADTLAEAERRFPGDLGILLFRADRLAAEGDFSTAEDTLREAAGLHPSEPLTTIRLSDLLCSRPDPASRSKGEEILEQAVAAPDCPASVKLRFAEVLLDTGGGDKALNERLDTAERLLREVDGASRGLPIDPAYRNYLEGRRLFCRNRFTAARAALENSIKADPVSVLPRLLLSRIHGIQGRFDQEVRQLSDVIAVSGPSPELLVRRAYARIRGGLAGITPAKHDLATALEMRPDFEPALMLLAQAHTGARTPDYAAAIEVLERALASPGASPRLHLSLGRVYMLTGNLPAAEYQVGQASKKAADAKLRTDCLATLAELRGTESGEFLSARAKQVWEEHLATHPEDVPAMLRYALLLLENGDAPDASRWADSARRADSSDFAGFTIAFEASLAQQDASDPDLEPAQKILADLEETAADSPAASYMRGRLALIEGDAAAAAALFRDAGERAPRDDRAALYLGLSLLRVNDLAGARAALQTAVRLRPRRLPARMLLAEVAYRLGREHAAAGDLPEAIDELQTAVLLRPGHSPSTALLAGARFNSGLEGSPVDLEAAGRDCRRLIDRLRETGEDNQMLSQAYLLLGDICRAREDWNGVVEASTGYFGLHPEDPGALMRKGMALALAGRAEEALPAFLAAAALAPSSWESAAAAAACRASFGEFEEAAAGIRRWIGANPQNAAALDFLGWFELRAGAAEQARQSFRKALSADADRLSSIVGLARSYWIGGDPLAAKPALFALLGTTRLEGEVRFLIGKTDLLVDPVSGAGISELLGAMRVGIEDRAARAWCHAELLGALFRAGRNEEALRESPRFARWVTLLEGSKIAPSLNRLLATGWFHAGQAHHRAGDLVTAEHRYRRAIEARPDSPAALNNLAELILRRPDAQIADIEEALSFARRATDLAQGHPGYLDTLGYALLAAGKAGEAVEVLEKGLRIMREALPNLEPGGNREEAVRQIAHSFLRLAKARLAAGDAGGARTALRLAEETWPGIARTPGMAEARKMLER